MKRNHKITLASLGVMLGILSGVLTIVEKTVNIVAQIKPPKASETPKNADIEKGLAVGIETDSNKSFARMSK